MYFWGDKYIYGYAQLLWYIQRWRWKIDVLAVLGTTVGSLSTWRLPVVSQSDAVAFAQNSSAVSSSGTRTRCPRGLFVAIAVGEPWSQPASQSVVEEARLGTSTGRYQPPRHRREGEVERAGDKIGARISRKAYLPPRSLRGLGAALLSLQLEPRSYTMRQQQVYHPTTNWQRIRTWNRRGLKGPCGRRQTEAVRRGCDGVFVWWLNLDSGWNEGKHNADCVGKTGWCDLN